VAVKPAANISCDRFDATLGLEPRAINVTRLREIAMAVEPNRKMRSDRFRVLALI